MPLTTPTPTGLQKDRTVPTTRKRTRELEAEAAKDPASVDSADVETLPRVGKQLKRPPKLMPKPTPGGKGKVRFQQRDVYSAEEQKRPGPLKPPHRAMRSTCKAGDLLTPKSEGILGGLPAEDNVVSSLKTPLAELKPGARHTVASTESQLPRNTRRELRSNVGVPTSIPSSCGTSKSKANATALANEASKSPESEHISSSSLLSPLTDLPDLPSSPGRPPVQDSSPIPRIPAFPPHTPHHKRVENRPSDLDPSRHPSTTVDSDEGVVPTSQSQDLRPFIVSPPRSGGSVRLKDTTPKALRRSQGYNNQPPQPLPSVLATIRARGHCDTGTRESNIVPASQTEETPVFSTPSEKGDKSVPRHHKPPSSEQSGILGTPTKVVNLPLDGKVHMISPLRGLLRSPKRGSPTHRDDNSLLTSSFPPSSIPTSTDPQGPSRAGAALDFVEYRATPTKQRNLIDSPRKLLQFSESQVMLSPTWSQPRSLERWRFEDILDEGQHGFGDGKAGLEAEAEGHEPGGGERTSSMTEAESQDLAEWFLRIRPELRFGGQAPSYNSGASSRESSKSAKDDAIGNGTTIIDDTRSPTCQNSKGLDPDPTTNHTDNVRTIPHPEVPGSLTESESQTGGSRKLLEESQGGIGESGLIFSQPSRDPLGAFLDMFEAASSTPLDSQSVIDIGD